MIGDVSVDYEYEYSDLDSYVSNNEEQSRHSSDEDDENETDENEEGREQTNDAQQDTNTVVREARIRRFANQGDDQARGRVVLQHEGEENNNNDEESDERN